MKERLKEFLQKAFEKDTVNNFGMDKPEIIQNELAMDAVISSICENIDDFFLREQCAPEVPA